MHGYSRRQEKEFGSFFIITRCLRCKPCAVQTEGSQLVRYKWKLLTECRYWIPSNTQNLCLPVASNFCSFFRVGMGRLMGLNITHWKVQSLWEFTTFYSTVTQWCIVSGLAQWLVTLCVVNYSSVGTWKQSGRVIVGSTCYFLKN